LNRPPDYACFGPPSAGLLALSHDVFDPDPESFFKERNRFRLPIKGGTYTQRISAVLGPTLIAVTLSEAINLNIWVNAHPTLVYLNGLIFFISGMFIITSHSRWKNRQEFLVTLSGYLLGLAGAYRMFFPMASQLGSGLLTYAVIALLGALGFVLSLGAFLKR
jgi:hypothetical protein